MTQSTQTPTLFIAISARLYEELKDYLCMETDLTAGHLLRRLRESADNAHTEREKTAQP